MPEMPARAPGFVCRKPGFVSILDRMRLRRSVSPPHFTAWWCNGSTGDFDSPSHGSNPCRAATSDQNPNFFQGESKSAVCRGASAISESDHFDTVCGKFVISSDTPPRFRDLTRRFAKLLKWKRRSRRADFDAKSAPQWLIRLTSFRRSGRALETTIRGAFWARPRQL